MPYKSRAQEAYFNANRSKLEKSGVDEWNKSSKGLNLPEKVDAIKRRRYRRKHRKENQG